MRVLSFPKLLKNAAGNEAQDWSQQEIADFYRAHRLLVENGAGIGMDRGVTDTGEPWMVFYDASTQDVFLHVARIDDSCILVCDTLDIHLKARDITALITELELAVRTHLVVREERNSNIVIHPAARIIMSISMVFLLFKLDNSAAYAKGMQDIRVPADAGSPRGVVSHDTIMGRAQVAFARMAESADTPANVAVLAGMILAGELMTRSVSQADTLDVPASTSVHEAILSKTAPDDSSVSFLSGDTSPKATAHTLADNTPAPMVVQPSEPLKMQVKSVVSEVTSVALLEARQEGARPPIDNITIPAASSSVEATPPTSTPTTTTALTILTGLVVDMSSEARKTNDRGPETSEKAIIADGALVKPHEPKQIVEISYDNLQSIHKNAGFSIKTSHTNIHYYNASSYISNLLGSLEAQSGQNGLLAKQAGLEGLADRDIGVWTHTLAEGAGITYVGQANILDDLMGFVS